MSCTCRPTEAEARKLELSAGYIVAELSNDGIPTPIDSGSLNYCRHVAQEQADISRGSAFGVFKVASIFESEAK